MEANADCAERHSATAIIAREVSQWFWMMTSSAR